MEYFLFESRFETRKGVVFLIHGSAPLKRNGRVPLDINSPYAKLESYKELALLLFQKRDGLLTEHNLSMIS
jgi:hypothetical protein